MVDESWRGWFSDEPLAEDAEAPGADSLPRLVSDVVAAVTMLSSSSGSSAVAITGPWGRGKSSIAEGALRALESSFHVIRFEVWRSGDPATLHLDFYRELIAALPLEAARLRNSLAKLSAQLAPFSKLGSIAGVDPSATLDQFSSLLAGSTSTSALLGRIERDLAKLDRPVLVMIDDLDRLPQDSVSAALRVVRLHGRVPRVHFLLAYDRAIVEAALAVDHPVRMGESFLDKIVQLEVEIPPLRRHVKSEWFQKALQDLWPFEVVPLNEHDLTSVVERLNAGILDRLATPRQLKRYFTTAMLGIRGRGLEVDVADFFTLTWLKLSRPDVYAFIWRHKAFFVSSLENITWERDQAKAVADMQTKLTARAKQDSLELSSHDVSLLQQLFPRLLAKPRDRQKQVADPIFFDRYFDAYLHDGDFSVSLFNEGIEGLDADGHSAPLDALVEPFTGPLFDRLDDLVETPSLVSPKLFLWLGRQFGAFRAASLQATNHTRRAEEVGARLIKQLTDDQRQDAVHRALAKSIDPEFVVESTLRASITPGEERDLRSLASRAKAQYSIDVIELLASHFDDASLPDVLDLPEGQRQLLEQWSLLDRDGCRRLIDRKFERGEWSRQQFAGWFTTRSMTGFGRSDVPIVSGFDARRLEQIYGTVSLANAVANMPTSSDVFDEDELVPATKENRVANALAALRLIREADAND